MKKLYLFFILLIGFSHHAFSQLITVKFSDVNFSLFKGSDGHPTESYENGVADFYLVEMDGLNSGKTFGLFFDFFTESGNRIYAGALGNESKYRHIANPSKDEMGFVIKDLTILKEDYTNSSRLLCIYLITDKQNPTQDPYAIRTQIYENEELYISASLEYSLENWKKLKSILSFLIGYPLEG